MTQQEDQSPDLGWGVIGCFMVPMLPVILFVLFVLFAMLAALFS